MPKSEPEHVLRMFLFFAISEADVLINSVLRQNTACNARIKNSHMKSITF